MRLGNYYPWCHAMRQPFYKTRKLQSVSVDTNGCKTCSTCHNCSCHLNHLLAHWLPVVTSLYYGRWMTYWYRFH